jgi:hypothetical protein
VTTLCDNSVWQLGGERRGGALIASEL